ncbi:uncharacterized membrane protein YgdD (TMEM256/DUF423 family) [Pedobacter sp. CG_S7]|uniref:conjugal transfer protein MobC n=1 Tax=Pedobacter sp. CG_S7 TaxID=3143930 RepID=UPI0033976274
MANTGENEQALRKIIDFTRYGSIIVLIIHFYFYLHEPLAELGWTHSAVDKVMLKVGNTGIFTSIWYSKLITFGLLVVSLLGAKGKKDEKYQVQTIVLYITFGLVLFFGSVYMLHLGMNQKVLAIAYVAVTSIGWMLILTGGNILSKLLINALSNDVFNTDNETFPQEERLLENEFSVNLPTRYNLKGKMRSAWINIINPFRGILVIGSPGAGKSYFAIRHIIEQHMKKGFSMFIYDFKFDDLSRLAYNFLNANIGAYPVKPKFYIINFDDLTRTHRCNPLNPESMTDITDASESAQTIMLGLNREWIKKQGDFFVESPINFVTAIIWFLRRYKGGVYCTLPHVIELMQVEYKKLFPILGTEPEIEVYINPFLSAYLNGAAEQLEGQIASAKIGLARLSSPQLYYVLSGNDFTLDINDPKEPKIVCMGNNPQKTQVYGAVLSLYVSRLIKIVNQKNKLKSSLLFDEFPTIFFNGIDRLIATARSNKVSTTLAVQDNSQLKKDYGRDQADVIMSIVGNVIAGQATGETAKNLSERFGKILQHRKSISVNSNDTSVSTSTQLDYAIPASTIANLSSGEFVGTVADNPEEKIKLKTFHSAIINDHDGIKEQDSKFVDIPQISTITPEQVQAIYLSIKKDIQNIVIERLDIINTNPEFAHLLIKEA